MVTFTDIDHAFLTKELKLVGYIFVSSSISLNYGRFSVEIFIMMYQPRKPPFQGIFVDCWQCSSERIGSCDQRLEK